MAEWHPASIVLQEIGYWQTLIAAGLAVLAAGLTIFFTVRSANREIEAAKEQTDTAQGQIEIPLRLDRQRNLYETRAFLIALRTRQER